MGKIVVLLMLVAAFLPFGIVPASAVAAPSWWNGNCDANHWNPAAAAKGWKGAGAHPLGASYLGVAVCGPRPSADHAPDIKWTKAGWGEYEWECPELAMRFMALLYGVNAYNANGNNVVRNYTSGAGGGLVKVSNGTAGKPPLPGDVMSFDSSTDPAGHVAVVASSSVDTHGNGSIRLITQNDTSDGWRTLSVSTWHVASFGSFKPYGWLHDPKGRGGSGGGTTTNHPPKGAVDSASGHKGHEVEVRGWTIDPDTKTQPTKVVVVVSGDRPQPFSTRIRTIADDPRPDIASRFPRAGKYHGFDVTTTLKRAQKAHVDVYAFDTTDASRRLIASLNVRVP